MWETPKIDGKKLGVFLWEVFGPIKHEEDNF